jgi:hypothetical protein
MQLGFTSNVTSDTVAFTKFVKDIIYVPSLCLISLSKLFQFFAGVPLLEENEMETEGSNSSEQVSVP